MHFALYSSEHSCSCSRTNKRTQLMCQGLSDSVHCFGDAVTDPLMWIDRAIIAKVLSVLLVSRRNAFLKIFLSSPHCFLLFPLDLLEG